MDDKQKFIIFATEYTSRKMEILEGIEFYKRCLADCDRVIADIYNSDIVEPRKQALIDKMLQTRFDIQKTIEKLEELLR